jgi:hypothetical protein
VAGSGAVRAAVRPVPPRTALVPGVRGLLRGGAPVGVSRAGGIEPAPEVQHQLPHVTQVTYFTDAAGIPAVRSIAVVEVTEVTRVTGVTGVL